MGLEEEVVRAVAGLNYFDYLYYLHYASFQYALLDCIFYYTSDYNNCTDALLFCSMLN